MIEVNFKYKTGDKVYWMKYMDHRVEVDCHICKKTGEIIFRNESFTCPKCHGTRVFNIIKEKWMCPLRLYTIGFSVFYNDEKKYLLKEDFYLEEDETIESLLINESDLFLIEEEAIIECKKRNKQL